MMTNDHICLRIKKLQQEQNEKQQSLIDNSVQVIDKIIGFSKTFSGLGGCASEFKVILKALEMKHRILGVTSPTNSNLDIINTIAAFLNDEDEPGAEPTTSTDVDK